MTSLYAESNRLSCHQNAARTNLTQQNNPVWTYFKAMHQRFYKVS